MSDKEGGWNILHQYAPRHLSLSDKLSFIINHCLWLLSCFSCYIIQFISKEIKFFRLIFHKTLKQMLLLRCRCIMFAELHFLLSPNMLFHPPKSSSFACEKIQYLLEKNEYFSCFPIRPHTYNSLLIYWSLFIT